MKKKVYLAVFAISSSVLIFETILLKFLNFKMICSWAFVIISIAFLGIGASGTYLYQKMNDANQKINFSLLSNFSTAYAISIPLSIMLFAWFPFSSSNFFVLENLPFIFFYMILFSFPFFFSGVCINYILSLKEFHVGRVLFFDLIGAGAGCILSVLFLRALGAWGILILSTSFAYLASMIFIFLLREANLKIYCIKRKIILPLILGLALLIFPRLMINFYQFDIASSNKCAVHLKAYREDFHGTAATYWNPIARLDLSREGSSNSYAFNYGLPKHYRSQKLTGRFILQDNYAGTRQFRFDLIKEIFGHFILSVPYKLRNTLNDLLNIGPGGGTEILLGKYFKVKHIDAVDINSDMINILSGKNKHDKMSEVYSGFSLSDAQTEVDYHAEEARSFLSKNRVAKYDLVQLSGVDIWTLLMPGAMFLSENYLYTQEALGYYYDALRENGYIQICYAGGPYALRLFVTALEMLSAKGIDRPERSLVVFNDGTYFTSVMIKNGWFLHSEIIDIKKICADEGFQILFMPGLIPDSDVCTGDEIDIKHYILASDNKTREALVRNFAYNIRSTFDDKPFFYSIYNAQSIERYNIFKGILYSLFQSKMIVILTLTGIILSFILILSPIIIMRIKSGSADSVPFQLLSFFAITGIAFALLEVVMLQKFAIFVGGPFYSMCITLPAILIFYGLGSFWASRIKLPLRRLLIIAIGAIVLYGLLGFFSLDKIIRNLFYLSHPGRIIFCIMLILPLAFFLGFPLAVVLESIKVKLDRKVIPWMWGVSSCGNVCGALLFAPISQVIGFNLLLLISCCLYLMALFFILPNKYGLFKGQ